MERGAWMGPLSAEFQAVCHWPWRFLVIKRKSLGDSHNYATMFHWIVFLEGITVPWKSDVVTWSIVLTSFLLVKSFCQLSWNKLFILVCSWRSTLRRHVNCNFQCWTYRTIHCLDCLQILVGWGSLPMFY